MALTDTEIRRSKPAEEPYRLSDSGGMYLVVSPSSGNLWRWKYRFDGKEKLMALGKYPQISLAMARERHADGRKLLAIDIDPMGLISWRPVSVELVSRPQANCSCKSKAEL